MRFDSAEIDIGVQSSRDLEGNQFVIVKAKMKSAGKIVLATFGTSVTAMIPLLLASLGELKGIAITSILTEAAGYFTIRMLYMPAIKLEFR